jgi:hypothetical protein
MHLDRSNREEGIVTSNRVAETALAGWP